MTLSVVIHTKNAAATLATALKSVAFADDIVVVDMQSTDETEYVAKRFTRNVFRHKDVGYADPARNYGLSKAKGDWILVLDADEEIPQSLATFIKAVVANETSSERQADVYAIPRKNLIFGQWLEHTGWWPDYQIRLFKSGMVSWQVGVHRAPDVKGTVLELPPTAEFAIVHHNYPSVSEYLDRLNRYTELTAGEHPEKATITAIDAFSTFGQELTRRLFAEQGIKDGLHGAALSLLQANYQLVVLLKQWEHHGFKTQSSETAVIKGLDRMTADLRYWLADWQVKHTSGLAQIWWRCRRKWKF